jgi:predicted NAD/FAD-binding protein
MDSVAVVGTGIAGMSAGHFLRRDFSVTFYEKNAYAGGHTNTVVVDENGRPVSVDTGFMVYNEVTYPNLVRFFNELGIPTKPTSMSFSVRHDPSGLEYCGTGLAGLFAQKKNLVSLRFWKMLGAIDRFNRSCEETLTDPRYRGVTIAKYVEEKNLGLDFLDRYLLPMSSAVWSTDARTMRAFPVVTLVRFFKNHGLLGGLSGHYTWRTVDGGSRVYRDKVMASFKDRVRLKKGVRRVERGDKISVLDDTGSWETYDRVVFACHADEALEILGDGATANERRLLGRFRYQKNSVALHTDESAMPKTKNAWSSWNYRIADDAEGPSSATTVYWMNSLQGVSKARNYFVSINDPGRVDPAKVLWSAEYSHPVYDPSAVEAQAELPRLNANGRTYFCGSYFKYGFHEDAFTSGLDAARSLAGREVWV